MEYKSEVTQSRNDLGAQQEDGNLPQRIPSRDHLWGQKIRMEGCTVRKLKPFHAQMSWPLEWRIFQRMTQSTDLRRRGGKGEGRGKMAQTVTHNIHRTERKREHGDRKNECSYVRRAKSPERARSSPVEFHSNCRTFQPSSPTDFIKDKT